MSSRKKEKHCLNLKEIKKVVKNKNKLIKCMKRVVGLIRTCKQGSQKALKLKEAALLRSLLYCEDEDSSTDSSCSSDESHSSGLDGDDDDDDSKIKECYRTIPKKHHSLKTAVRESGVINKNKVAQLWCLSWLGILYYIKDVDYECTSIFSDPQCAADIITSIIDIYSSACFQLSMYCEFWNDFCRNYKSELTVNNLPVVSTNLSVFSREPLYVAFSPYFINYESDCEYEDEDLDKKNVNKRYVLFVLNINTIKRVYDQYIKESVLFYNNIDSGLVDISPHSLSNHLKSGDRGETKRNKHILLKLLLLSVVHAFGHADLFCKYHNCSFEKHDIKSELFKFSFCDESS